jgi:phage/plasmid-like protein (TIGR03299 family)
MGRLINSTLVDKTSYPSVREACKGAGLDWAVETRPLYARIPNPNGDGGTMKRADNLYGVVRSDNHATLGAVTGSYTCITNEEGFAPLDELVSEGGLVLGSGGQMKGGKTVFLQAYSPKPLVVGGEQIGTSIIAIMRHDGGGSLNYFPSFVRFFCTNQLRALYAAKAAVDQVWTKPIRHMASATERIAAARKAIAALARAEQDFKATAETLLDRTFTASEMEALARRLLPEPTDATTTTREANAWEARFQALMVDAYRASDLNDIRHTAWGALNAVADYEQHLVRVKGSPEAQDETLLKRSIEEGSLTATAVRILTSV